MSDKEIITTCCAASRIMQLTLSGETVVAVEDLNNLIAFEPAISTDEAVSRIMSCRALCLANPTLYCLAFDSGE